MLSKKFQAVIDALRKDDRVQAYQIHKSLDPVGMGKAASDLYAELSRRLGGVNEVSTERAYELPPGSTTTASELASVRPIPGISIVSCCMDRNENLQKAIKSWLLLDVNEIVIIDWSSKIPVSESLSDFVDDRIRIIRVEGEKRWVLSYAFNLAIRLASFSKVFKLDADIEVQPSFLEQNSFFSGEFVRGYWKKALDEGRDSQVYVNGSFGAEKQALLAVGGYNEFIRTYGWDDSDLYERLSSQGGLKTKYLSFDSLCHLEQQESERTENQDTFSEIFMKKIPVTEFNNQHNRFIGRNTDYWELHMLQDYELHALNNGHWLAKRTTQDMPLPDYFLEHAGTYAALSFLKGHHHEVVSKASDTWALGQFLYNEFLVGIDFDVSLSVLGVRPSSALMRCFNGKIPYSSFLEGCCQEARRTGRAVVAISVSDGFVHRFVGDHEASVEVLSIPLRQVEMIFAFRENNLCDSAQFTVVDVEDQSVIQAADSVFEPKVYVDAQHGLGNRLRAIASAAAIADSAGRELVIVWEPDHHCDCEFSDLFSYDGTVLSKSLVSEARRTMSVYNYMEIEPGAMKGQEVVLHDDRHLYLRSAYVFNSPSSNWDSENKFLKTLVPSSRVQQIVDSLNIDGDFLAAHVRMEAGKGLDHNSYDSVDNWTQEGHDELHYWREKSHYSHFIKRIDGLLASGEFKRIFLATDMQETYDIFAEYYGDKLMYIKRQVFDRSAEQIQYALADAIWLGRSAKLLGSTWSSFSELAIRLSSTINKVEMSGKEF